MNDTVIKYIDRGTFGKISLVEHNNEQVARKEITFKSESIEEVKKEINILTQLKDRSVLILKDSIIDESNHMCYIYTEYLERGNLWRKIDEKKKAEEDFTVEEIISYMEDLISGLKYIHSRGIIHRDLKPGNILVGRHNELIICDFGLAIENKVIDDILKGTLNYMAPELFKIIPRPYSTASDIFALGCILYEIYTLRMLYNGKTNREIVNDIFSGKELDFRRINENRIPRIEELIMRMLDRDVNKRIKLNEIEEEINRISDNRFYNVTVEYINSSCPSEVNSLILDFYLGDGSIKGKSLKEIIKMNDEEFSCYWNDDFVNIFFPSINQNNPPYTKEDALELKKHKDKYLNDLHRLIEMINHNKDNLESMIQFLKSIDDIEYMEKLQKEKNTI